MRAKLQDALKDAMRSKDKVALETIRGILSSLQYEEMQRGVEALPDATALEVLQREVKKRKEELEFAEKSARPEWKEKVTAEIAVIEKFLPQQLGAAEIEKIITDLRAADPALNMGLLMKALKEKYSGQYDAKVASEIAKRVCG